MDDKKNLMLKFLEDRKHLDFIEKDVHYHDNDTRPHLLISNPAILSSFMGYLKFQSRKDHLCDVLIRGQTRDYARMLPSIFRGEKRRFRILLEAQAELSDGIKHLKPTIFQNEPLEDLFQHYGIKSTGIDVVDNIFIALWFALMEHKCLDANKRLYTFARSKEEFGWIYFLKVGRINRDETVDNSFPDPFVSDLRRQHSSLSLRLHCQHAYMINSSNQDLIENLDDLSYDKCIVATVRIPNSDNFLPQGDLFSINHLFPGPDMDNTYKIFLGPKFEALLRKIERIHSLEHGELGEILNYSTFG